MALKEFCKTLQQCAEALEHEVKSNINEFHNLFFGKNMNEVQLALERAKDYHYKEIADAASEIMKNVKIIIFHQAKIEWLSHEDNFTESDLKRFSYVKRQVYAFSKSEETPMFSKSVENLATVPKNRRERRRTASEVSIGTLEAWEKYMEKKEHDQSQLEENVEEVKKIVPKRILPNTRARKKFVSSTMGGFLDVDSKASRSLESIIEHFSTDEEEAEAMPENSHFVESCCGGIETNEWKIIEESSIINLNSENTDNKLEKNNPKELTDLVHKINNTLVEEDAILNEIMGTFLNNDEQLDKMGCQSEHIKPKIVDVIYKKKPS